MAVTFLYNYCHNLLCKNTTFFSLCTPNFNIFANKKLVDNAFSKKYTKKIPIHAGQHRR